MGKEQQDRDEEKENAEDQGMETERRKGEYNRKIQENCEVEANGKDTLDDLWQRIKIAIKMWQRKPVAKPKEGVQTTKIPGGGVNRCRRH